MSGVSFSELFLVKGSRRGLFSELPDRIDKQICIGVHKMACDTHKEAKSMMFKGD